MAYIKDKKSDKPHAWIGPSFGPMTWMLSLLIRLKVIDPEKLSIIRSSEGHHVRYDE